MNITLTVDGLEIINTDKIVSNGKNKIFAYKDNKVINIELHNKDKNELLIEVKPIK